MALCRRSRAGSLALVAAVLLGCATTRQLAMDNRSDRDLLVRVTETGEVDGAGDRVTTFRVAALTIGDLFPAGAGALKGRVELLTTDCELLGTTEARGGTMIEYGVNAVPSVHELAADYDGMGLGAFPTAATDPCSLEAPVAVPSSR